MESSHRGPIVVGVDGSAWSERAARWAAAEAILRKVPLVLANAEAARPIEPAWLAELVARLRTDGAEQVSAEVSVGAAAAMLLEASRQAALVVVGERGMGGFEEMLAGSTALAVATHAPCPVVVVRGPAEPTGPALDGPVMVGIDGSPTSEAALGFAFEEASLRGADLVAVHTWTDVVVDPVAGVVRRRDEWPAIEQEEDEVLGERLAGWQRDYPDVTVQRRVLQDRPVRALLEQAEGAQLLVVGSHGEGGFTGMLMGSTSQALVQYAPCPVAVVRPPAPDDEPPR